MPSIPGPTGPTGPQGLTGPTGPIGITPVLALLRVETFSDNGAWSTQADGRLYRVVTVGSGASGAGARVVLTSATTTPGASAGGGGAWQEEWFTREQLHKDIVWPMDGFNDSVLLGNVLRHERTDTWSVSGWFTKHPESGDPGVLSNLNSAANARGWSVYIHSDGFPHFQLINNLAVNDGLDVASPFPLHDGRRHHVVWTYTGNSLPSGVTIYIDDVAIPVGIITNGLTGTIVGTGDLSIGKLGDFAGNFFYQGDIEDLSVWDVVLTAGNVTTLFNGGTPGDLSLVSFIANLDAWWKLDSVDTVGANGIIDYGPSGFHGTVQGGLVPGMHGVVVAPSTPGGLGATATVATRNAGYAGTSGGPSSFGRLLVAYGGGRGGVASGNTSTTGGGGGGSMSNGAPSNDSNTPLIAGGEPNQGLGLAGSGGGGSGGPTPAFVGGADAARPAVRGGGHGGFSLAGGAGRSGAKSRKGGGGGGPGGGVGAGGSGQNGSQGGNSGAEIGTSPYNGDGGTGGVGTISSGLVVGSPGGDGGSGTEDHAGDGGGGGGAGVGVGAVGGKGGDGGIPGGGGGGGGTAGYASGAAVTSGDGGIGARGQVTVYTYG